MSSYKDSHTEPGRGCLYDDRYETGIESLYFRSIERPLLDGIFRKLAKERHRRYLDVACGTGRILEIAYPHFEETVGIDISEEMLKQARRKVPGARLIARDLAADAEGLGKFDVVTLFRFILNAEPDLRSAALKGIRRLIAEDGVLVLNNHMNAGSLLARMLRMRNKHLRDKRHSIVAESEIDTLVNQAGFKVERSYGLWYVPPFRDRLILPASLTLAMEKQLSARSGLQAWAKERIYVCRPV